MSRFISGLANSSGTKNGIYEGLIATRARVNNIGSFPGFDTTNKQLMVRSTHVARTDITSLKIMAVNFYRSSSGGFEPGSGATATVSASVEYPATTCTRITFSSSNDGSIPDADVLLSDSTSVTIPNGATFWIRQYIRSSGGTIYDTPFPGRITGDQFKVGVTVTDQTMSGDTITGGDVGMHFPLGIIGPTRNPSVAIIGDSIGYGLGGSPTSIGDMGTVAPSIGPVFAYTDLSVPGERAGSTNGYVNASINRAKIYPYVSHIINELGLNDIADIPNDLPGLKTRIGSLYTQLAARAPSALVFQTTLTPGVSTSDACATLGGQTSFPEVEAPRTGFNDELRAATFGPPGGCFELADVIETSRNSGFWKTSPQKYSDGPTACSHLNTYGYGRLVTDGAIDTSRIHKP